MSLWGLAGGGSIIFLRVFRAFRVMRLFKKLQPMRKILIPLGACVKPVASAFVILFILASIYAQVPFISHAAARGVQRPPECPGGAPCSPLRVVFSIILRRPLSGQRINPSAPRVS